MKQQPDSPLDCLSISTETLRLLLSLTNHSILAGDYSHELSLAFLLRSVYNPASGTITERIIVSIVLS